MERKKIREIVKGVILNSYVGTELTVADNNAIRVITEKILELFNSGVSKLRTNLEDLENILAAQSRNVASDESLAEAENLREQLKQQTEAREELVDKLTNAASLITKLQGASKEKQLIEQVADLKVELEEKDRVRWKLEILERKATDKLESVEKQMDKFKGDFYRALGYIDRVNEGKHPTPKTHGYGDGTLEVTALGPNFGDNNNF